MNYQSIKVNIIVMIIAFFSSCSLLGKNNLSNTNNTDDIDNFKMGNISGNISNNAHVAFYNGWIYISYGNIYKMSPDGNHKQRISDMKGDFLNVTQEGIFFIDRSGGYKGSSFFIFRMNHDGTGVKQLNSQWSFGMIVLEEWIYYCADPSGNNGPDTVIYRMKTDGTQKQQLNNEKGSMHLIVEDNWLCFTDRNLNGSIWKMNFDGSRKREIYSGYAQNLIYYNNWIYFVNESDSRKLYRMSVDGSDIKMVVNRNIDFYNIHENQIYYTQYIKNDHSIHAISINGKKDRVVCDSRGDFLSIAGNYLFFLSNAPGGGPRDFVLYKTPLSGGKAEIEQLIK